MVVACRVVVVAALFVLVGSVASVAQLDSPQIAAEIDRAMIEAGTADRFDRETLAEVLRWLLTVVAVLAVATVVFGIFAARGHGPSRIALTVLVPAGGLSWLVSGWLGLLPALLAVGCVVLLWLPDSRAWYAAVRGGPASPSPVTRGVAMSSSAPPPGHEPHDRPGAASAHDQPGAPPPPQYGQGYGQQQPPQRQPSYEQPPAYGQQPYGAPYGQQPLQPPSPYPAKRPGGVTAAAVIAIVMSVLTGGFWLVIGLFMVSGGDAIIEAIRDDANLRQQLDDSGVTLAQVEDSLGAFGAGAIVAGVVFLLTLVPAIGVLRGSNVARVGLVVLSVFTVVVGVVFAFAGGLGIPWVLAGIATIALLFAGSAGAWFAGKKAGAV